MTEDQRLAAFGAIALLVVVIMAAAVFGTRKSNRDIAEVQIARIIERNPSSFGASVIGLMFGVATILCFINYTLAITTDRQIVALLLWIANSAFWGVCLLANLITQSRTSAVYRDRTPDERQEPPL